MARFDGDDDDDDILYVSQVQIMLINSCEIFQLPTSRGTIILLQENRTGSPCTIGGVAECRKRIPAAEYS
jgi:hypothetical protein